MPSTNSKDELTGAVIQAARKRDRVGLRELARRTSISPGYLSRIEAGSAHASAEVLMRIADELDRPIVMLLAISGHAALADAVSGGNLAARLLDDWAGEADRLAELEDPEKVLLFLCDAFVEIRRLDVLEGIGFTTEHHPGLTSERARAVQAFQAEQRVLSDLDRRGSNPAPMKIAGRLANDEDETRFQAILAKYGRVDPTEETPS